MGGKRRWWWSRSEQTTLDCWLGMNGLTAELVQAVGGVMSPTRSVS